MRNAFTLPLVLALSLPLAVQAASAMIDPPVQQAQQVQTTQPPGSPTTRAIQYDSEGRYVEPQALGSEDKVWLGDDGQYHCKRKDGTTGLVIGAVVGGLFGSVITGKSTLGTILGTVGGGLLGRSIERGEAKCQ